MIEAKGTNIRVEGLDSQIYHELCLTMREWYRIMRDRGSGELGVKQVLKMVQDSVLYQIEEDYQEKKKAEAGDASAKH